MRGTYRRYYLVGFADAEGCFSVALKKEPSTRFGWALDPLFQVTQHKSNMEILKMFKQELSCGRIIEKPGQPNLAVFIVDNRRQLVEKVIPFFEKYKLLGKRKDFELFKEIVQGLEKKMHYKKDTFIELIKKAFKMNLNGKQRHYKLEEIIREIKSS